MVSALSLDAFAKMEEQDLLEFVDDTIKYLKGQKVAFLTKYSAAFGN